MMPIVGARTMLPKLSAGSYFQGVVRYDLSFAGDPTKKNISNLQLWPMADAKYQLTGSLVFYSLSKRRHTRELRRSSHRSDRSIILAFRFQCGAELGQEFHSIA
jgi:hypothetical protein